MLPPLVSESDDRDRDLLEVVLGIEHSARVAGRVSRRRQARESAHSTESNNAVARMGCRSVAA